MTKKVLYTATVGSHILAFHLPYLKMLQEKGYEVHVATNGTAEIPHCDVRHTVSFHRSPFKLDNLRAIGQLKKIVDREHYDIIHTHTPMGGVVTRLAALDARKKGTRVIYTAHGFHFFKGAPMLNWLVYYPIEKLLAYKTDDLITINQEDYKRAKAKFKTKVHYVPGVGVDPKKFDFKMTKAEKSELRKSLGLKDSDFVMIYPAELNKNKNQKMLIDVMEKLVQKHPNIHLLLPGKDSLNGFHQSYIEQRELSKNIHLLGFRKDIPKLLKISDLAVSSSKREGLPVNIIEAMAIGLPVVATACRGASELIEDGSSGYLVELDDSEAMADKIMDIFNDKRLQKSLQGGGKSRSKLYELGNITSSMADIYKIEGSQSDPIRVLHVVTIMNRAGLETMLMNYYRNIDRTKVQFDFLVHRYEKGDYDDEILSLGGKIYRFDPIFFKDVFTYVHKHKDFFSENPGYRIVHSHLDSLSALPLSLAKKAGIPVRIAHSHVNGFDKGNKTYSRQVMKRFISIYATDYAGCSKEALQFMFGKFAKRGFVIANAIDIQKFRYNTAKRKKMRDDLGLSDEFTIGHVGRFSYPKNHDFLIDIFKELKSKQSNSVLLLVGTGGNEEAIKQKVTDLGLNDNVKFLGLRSDIEDVMQAMDVFVLPSIYEGLGIVGIEAQASGLPCIVSDKVSSEVRLSESCSFLSLGYDKDIWANEIVALYSKNKDRTVIDARMDEYDIKKSSKVLQAMYIGVSEAL